MYMYNRSCVNELYIVSHVDVYDYRSTKHDFKELSCILVIPVLYMYVVCTILVK